MRKKARSLRSRPAAQATVAVMGNKIANLHSHRLGPL
jgi:hypothetical protein